MSDGEVPAENKLSDPSGVDVGVNEVVPEIPGHAREGRNQNTQALLKQALGSTEMKQRGVLPLTVTGDMKHSAPGSTGTVQSQHNG